MNFKYKLAPNADKKGRRESKLIKSIKTDVIHASTLNSKKLMVCSLLSSSFTFQVLCQMTASVLSNFPLQPRPTASKTNTFMLPSTQLLMTKNPVHPCATPTLHQAMPATFSSSIAAHACWGTFNPQTHTHHPRIPLLHISMKVSNQNHVNICTLQICPLTVTPVTVTQ